MEHLKGLTNLTALHMSGTQVSDAGVAHLKGMTNLDVGKEADIRARTSVREPTISRR